VIASPHSHKVVALHRPMAQAKGPKAVQSINGSYVNCGWMKDIER
jgi:hypothetical protein